MTGTLVVGPPIHVRARAALVAFGGEHMSRTQARRLVFLWRFRESMTAADIEEAVALFPDRAARYTPEGDLARGAPPPDGWTFAHLERQTDVPAGGEDKSC